MAAKRWHLIVWSEGGPLTADDLHARATGCYWHKAPARQEVYARWLARHGRLET